MGRTDFSDQLRQSACLVINPVTVDNFAALFILHAVGSGVILYDGPYLKLYILVGWDRSFFVCYLVHRRSTDTLLLQIPSGVVWQTRDLHLSHKRLNQLSPHSFKTGYICLP